MIYDWKITYINYNGEIISVKFTGTLQEISYNFFPSDGNSNAILKIEKLSKE